jgi:RNase H-fold protein (predicted Holliday junction resolvase)
MEMKADARRRVVDKVAAAVMLQSFIDHRRNLQAKESQS